MGASVLPCGAAATVVLLSNRSRRGLASLSIGLLSVQHNEDLLRRDHDSHSSVRAHADLSQGTASVLDLGRYVEVPLDHPQQAEGDRAFPHSSRLSVGREVEGGRGTTLTTPRPGLYQVDARASPRYCLGSFGLARGGGSLAGLADLQERVRGYVASGKAESTLRAYRADWRDFDAWCEARGVGSLPAAPDVLAAYLADRADSLSVSTLQRRIVAIGQAPEAAGHENPTRHPGVRATWRGIRRAKGVAPAGKAPATTTTVRAMVQTLPEGVLGTRDRALLLLGFAGAFRRSELVALDREDIQVTSDGIVVTVRRSKTDQEGEGRKVGIPYGSFPATCPVRAVSAWLDAASIASGPVFRRVNRHGHVLPARLAPQAVAIVVKRAVAAAGMDPTDYAGHSLRAGLATSAAAAGVSERAIMAQTGHRSVTTARRYIRGGSLFRENAAAGVGL